MMYYIGQVIYSRELKKAIVSENGGCLRRLRGTHFIRSNDEYRKFLMSFGNYEGPKPDEYVIALPKTVEEAKEQMEKGLISPAPYSTDHH